MISSSLPLNRLLYAIGALAFAAVLGGCGPGAAIRGTPTPKPGTPIPTPPVAHITPTPSTPQPVHYHVSAPYKAFVHSVCTALSAHDGNTIVNDLPYYQYNSAGLYYGTFNRSEGQSASPSQVTQWVSSGHVQCVRYAPDTAGHGVIATEGWSIYGGWGVMDLDKFGANWKINDVTFGGKPQVMHAFYSTSAVRLKYQ